MNSDYRLKSFRETLNMNQSEMAACMGIEQSTYSKYEKNDKLPEYAIIILESKFNFNRAWFSSGEGSMKLMDAIPGQLLANEDMSDYRNNRIDQLIEQNNRLVQQVSDLIKMQLVNAETIRTLAASHVVHQNRELNSG